MRFFLMLQFLIMVNIVEFEFDNKVIEFDLSGEDVMINATEMGNIYGKIPYDFLKQEGTKKFIAELKSAIPAFRSDSESERNAGNEDLTLKNDDRSDPNSPNNAIMVVKSDIGGADGGATWMHRQLALKFAAWLNPKFEVWIYNTIDRLLFEHARRTSEELKEKAKLSDRRDELISRLQSLPDFQEFMQVEYKIRQASNRIAKFNNNQLSIFRGN